MAAAPFCEAAMSRVNDFVSAERAANPPPADGEYGGTAVVGGVTELIGGMNAFQADEVNQRQHQQFVNLMTLVQVDEALEPTPWLAESWEVSEDGTALTFRLRDDVFWHDGERTDAYDVAFTYLRVTDRETAYPNAAFFRFYVPGREGVEVADSFTVTFRMEPHSEVLDPWRVLAIMPEHLLGDVPASELAEHPYGTRCPVGNGPFVFLSHRQDESWTFEANPAFPKALGGRPYLDRLVYRVVPEQTTLLTELLAGNVDVFVNARPDQADVIRESDAAELLVTEARGFTFVAWNTRRPQLRDARVRRALTMAVDRPAAVDALLQGYGTLATSGVPPFHWAFDPDLTGVAYDPSGARALLDEAGWTDRDGDGVRENRDGLPLELGVIFNAANQGRRAIAELMQAQLREVGVALTPVPLEGQALRARATDPDSRDFDGLILEWIHEFRVDETDLFAGDGPLAFAGLRDAEVAGLLESLQVEMDREVARPLWISYQRRIDELQPYTYFFFAQRLAGVSSRLQGVEMDYRGHWSNVRDWRIAPSDR
jgi:peptide/nickel transport system substrate-binding protein